MKKYSWLSILLLLVVSSKSIIGYSEHGEEDNDDTTVSMLMDDPEVRQQWKKHVARQKEAQQFEEQLLQLEDSNLGPVALLENGIFSEPSQDKYSLPEQIYYQGVQQQQQVQVQVPVQEERQEERSLGVQEQKCKTSCERTRERCKKTCNKKFDKKKKNKNGKMMMMMKMDMNMRNSNSRSRTTMMPKMTMMPKRNRKASSSRTGRASRNGRTTMGRNRRGMRRTKEQEEQEGVSSRVRGGVPFVHRDLKMTMKKDRMRRMEMAKSCKRRCKQATFRCKYKCYPPKCKRECKPQVTKCLDRCNLRKGTDGAKRTECRVNCYKGKKFGINQCFRNCNRGAMTPAPVSSEPASVSGASVSGASPSESVGSSTSEPES